MGCGTCLYRDGHYRCRNRASPLFERTVDGGDTCDFFEENPGSESLYCARVLVIEKGVTRENAQEIIEHCRRAIELGVAANDECSVRLLLSDALTTVADLDDVYRSPDVREAMHQTATAVEVDRREGLKHFESRLGRSSLSKIDVIYSMVSELIRRAKGAHEAIRFLEEKCEIHKDLRAWPLLHTTLELGCLYAKTGFHEKARACFKTIVESDILDPDSPDERKIRDFAQGNLERLPGARSTSGCFIATAAFHPSAPEVRILRRFRDQYLLNVRWGRIFVRGYYAVAPYVARWITKSELRRRVARRFVLTVVTVLGDVNGHE